MSAKCSSSSSRGQVQLYRISPEGKKLVIAALGAGAIFGEMALLGQQMHNAFAEAMDDSVILVMSRADLERLILNKPILGLRMLEITGRRLSDAEARWKIWRSRASRHAWHPFCSAWPLSVTRPKSRA